MSSTAAMRLLWRVLADAGVWLVAPVAFLLVYLHSYPVSSAAVVAHMRIVATLWLAVAALRVAINAATARAPALLASAGLLAIVWALFIAYYMLVVTGLESWGRVITWDLIRTYAMQFPAFLDALGVSLGYIVAGLILAFSILFALARLFLIRFDWTPWLSRHVSPAVLAIVLGASAGIVGTEVYAFIAAPWTAEREPVSLTLFPREASRSVQTHRIDRGLAERLDVFEDAARASYTRSDAAVRRNVILIVVDALRADHLALFGYKRNTNPRLSALAASASSMAAVTLHAVCAESACGLMALASSKYVHQLSNRPITLTEILKRNGYVVHLILSGDHAHFYGLREAYGKVDTYYDGSMAHGYYMNDDRLVIDKVGALPEWDGVPVMFQFHLMSTHVLGKREDKFKVFSPALNYSVRLNQEKTHGLPSQAAVNYYDNGVLQTDSVIAQLIAQLGSKGYLKNAVVAITADHGELLGEHGLYTHAKSAYEQVLQVPLILLSFGYVPEHSMPKAIQGSQVDVAPTILAELGIPKPATWVGAALQSGREAKINFFQEGPYSGLFDRRAGNRFWKYYVDTRTGREHVIDLLSDPAERSELTSAIPPALMREWRSLTLVARGASAD